MNLTGVLLLGLLGAPVAAGAVWASEKMDLGWNARQRVFNSAAIMPTIIAMGAACFAVVVLFIGDSQRLSGATNFLIQAIIAIFATFSSGMLAAYFVEWVRGK